MRFAKTSQNDVLSELVISTIFIISLLIVVLLTTSEIVWNICALLLLFSNTFFTWKATNKGLHPSFLFQLFFIFFQGGRLISFLMAGGTYSVWQIDLYGTPSTLTLSSIKIVILLLGICSYIIYLTALIKIPAIKVGVPEISSSLFLRIFVATLPFYIYKNVAYLYYIFTHGGYIAIYANNGEHLQSVGIFIRVLSNLCFSAYLLYIVQETNLKRMRGLMIFFLIVSCLELVIGLRGKYFVFLLMNVLQYKQKSKKGFKLFYLFLIALVVVFASIFIALFRENLTVETGSLVERFFYTQGNSSIVSAMAVENYEVFHPNALSYLLNSVLLSFRHLNSFGPGTILAADFTNFLSPEAYDLGFGTGTTFIAELYLVYKIPAVVVGTFLLGISMSFLKNYQRGLSGSIAFILLIGCVYLPRSSYLDPLAQFIKYGFPCLFVYVLALVCTLLLNKKIRFSVEK